MTNVVGVELDERNLGVGGSRVETSGLTDEVVHGMGLRN